MQAELPARRSLQSSRPGVGVEPWKVSFPSTLARAVCDRDTVRHYSNDATQNRPLHGLLTKLNGVRGSYCIDLVAEPIISVIMRYLQELRGV